MERFFSISQRGSTVRREVIGGITTFFAMAYIIFVNPNTLCANVGTAAEPFFPAMPAELWGPVLVATCVSAAIGCFLTGLLANVPFAQAPGMGLNAFFTYTVCLGMGYTWQEGLAIVLLSGLLFLAISVSPLRKQLIASIPDFLKHAISAGIGLFIAFIGLLNVGLISISGAVPALQLSMLVDGQRVWNAQGLLPLLTAVISFAIVDCFDTLGALVGLSANAGLADEDGRGDRALIADALATCCGACIGTSTVTTFAESSTGIAEGARTGLSSMVVGVLFLFSVFLAPVAGIIPAAATAPALIIVGVLTMRSAISIPWDDMECAVPAFLTIAVMPFAYSISDGIAFGFISYSLIKLVRGKGREVSLLTYGISLVFIFKYLLGNLV